MSAISRHKAAWSKASGKPTSPAATPVAGSDAVWVAACKHDWDQLKAIPDHAARNRMKPALLDKYRQYLHDWVYAHRRDPAQNDALTRNLVWAIDCNDWQYARNLADACAVTKQVFTFIERTPCTFFVDSLVQTLEKGNLANHALDIALTIPGRVETDPQWAINPIAQAKLYRILAKLEKDNDPPTALRYATAAHTLYPNVGVKTLIEQLQTVVDGSSAAPVGTPATPPPRAVGKPTEEGGFVVARPVDPVGDAVTPVFLDT